MSLTDMDSRTVKHSSSDNTTHMPAPVPPRKRYVTVSSLNNRLPRPSNRRSHHLSQCNKLMAV